ncbi:MAG: hypothetical protein HRU19_15290 [Pseudobacteriovorax sp.]|nr:hypothetical protein [Pseudobacteriovorax sp.]
MTATRDGRDFCQELSDLLKSQGVNTLVDRGQPNNVEIGVKITEDGQPELTKVLIN